MGLLQLFAFLAQFEKFLYLSGQYLQCILLLVGQGFGLVVNHTQSAQGMACFIAQGMPA